MHHQVNMNIHNHLLDIGSAGPSAPQFLEHLHSLLTRS